jgi:hypothetical protein
MQVDQIKAVVDAASPEERLLLTAYLRLKTMGSEGPLGIALTEARQRLDSGHAASLDQAWALHRDLN